MTNDRVEQEAMHAWAQAHSDGLGWVGFDISNGISRDTRYVCVATGRDYVDAAPVNAFSYGTSMRSVGVSVEQHVEERRRRIIQHESDLHACDFGLAARSRLRRHK